MKNSKPETPAEHFREGLHGLKEQMAEQAPEWRDAALDKAGDLAGEIQHRYPEWKSAVASTAASLKEEIGERMPDDLSIETPAKKKKKSRFRRFMKTTLVLAAIGAVAAVVAKRLSAKPAAPVYTPPRTQPRPPTKADGQRTQSSSAQHAGSGRTTPPTTASDIDGTNPHP